MSLRLLMVNQTVKKLFDIMCNVLVKVESFIFPANFIIIDYEVDFQDPIILGQPFLAMGRALIDMDLRHIKF